MKKQLLFFIALLLAILPSALQAATWSFEWNKSRTDKTSQGFYNFGSSFVDQDVYTTELNGRQWSISSDGTKKYAYVASSGQSIGTATEVSTHTQLWTSAFSGRITAFRIQTRTTKDTNKAKVSVKVNGVSYLSADAAEVEYANTLSEIEFKPKGEAQEGKLEISIDPTTDAKGTLFIKKIEVDYEEEQSAIPAPLFSPAAGTYDTAQKVTLAAEGLTDGKYTIYYTTDGTNPRLADGSRQTYTEPIDIAASATVKAVTAVGEEYSSVSEANYIIRKDAQLSFYKDSISLTSGDEGYADLLNPNKLTPIKYKSSALLVCSVDSKGTLYSSYVEKDSTVTISAIFEGNEEYKPDTATMKVTVVAKEPLKTPVVTPLGGTFNEPTEVTISTDDDRAVTIWYSTTASSEEDFKDDNTKSVITEGKQVTLTIDKTCRLYVMTVGENVYSPVVTADFTVNIPLKANFTTDKAATPYYTQNFDSQEEVADWAAGKGWKLANKKFSAIDATDVTSIAIDYEGDGTSTLTSPEFTVKENSSVEYYAYFEGKFLIWGSWQFNVIDAESGETTELMDAFKWAQDNAYTGPNWNKFSFDLAKFAGKKVKFEFNYNFGGENLAIDGFRLLQEDASAQETIRLFEGESVTFRSTSTGEPESLEWAFAGGDPATSTEASPTVKYNTAGTYDVTLTVKRGDESDTCERHAFVVVSQKAPAAKIGLPEEGYESPFVGVFIPTNVPVTFHDLSTGNPTEWNWVFQNTDKTSSTEQNPTVTYINKGRFSVGLTAKNSAGSSNDMLAYAIQAGGAQYVWNIGIEENQNIEKIAMGWYGNYAGSNWLGMNKFAELYKAPLADATVDSVAIYFASNTTVSPDADITLTMNSVAESGEPGEVLATTSMKASELRCSDDSVIATVFHFAEPVELKAGTPFFICVGPFPASTDEATYASDDIAIYCVRRGEGGKNTAWHYLEDQNDQGEGLGTFKWFANSDDPLSMAIAPVIAYKDAVVDNIHNAKALHGDSNVKSVYTLGGQKVSTPKSGNIYIVRYADGNSKKVVWQ